MRLQEIEVWVLRAIASAQAGRVEDSAVELKTEWPDAVKAARQLAGHANAASGSPILWIIGLSEAGETTPRGDKDPAEWWAQAVAEFDEKTAPEQVSLVVSDGRGGSVYAMCFTTDRAPYLVKNPTGMLPHREVPFRAGTGLRTARRSDLLSILVPAATAPTLSFESVRLGAYGQDADGYSGSWHCRGVVYFVSPTASRAVFRTRQMSLVVKEVGTGVVWPTERAEVSASFARTAGGNRPVETRLQTVRDGVDQLIVEGHGYARLSARGTVPREATLSTYGDNVDELQVTLRLLGVELPVPLLVEALLKETGEYPNEDSREGLIAEWKWATPLGD